MGSIPTVSTTWISRNLPLDSFTKKYGGVAQLVRVFGSHPKGRGFESLRLHHFCTVRFDGLFFSASFWFTPAPTAQECFCRAGRGGEGWGGGSGSCHFTAVWEGEVGEGGASQQYRIATIPCCGWADLTTPPDRLLPNGVPACFERAALRSP